MTPLKTFSNGKTALDRNKSSCLLHTGQTEQHHLLQLYKTSPRFSGEEGTQLPSELNHFLLRLGNYGVLPATASLHVQNPKPKSNSELPLYHEWGEDSGSTCEPWGQVENRPGTESKSPSTFVWGQQTKHSECHTQNLNTQPLLLSPGPP